MPSFKFASATGSGSSLIVTCSDQFAGKTITCTNGTKTYTRTCPSTSPYEVVFKGIAPGTWTVSGVVEGQTYSQQVVITDFDVILTAGFYYKQWVTLGGLDPTDYTDLEDVFADEVAVRRLMTIHASADYLIEKVTDDIDTIDDFTANDTAMKWIGLRDYVCDGLTAITGVEAKFLASEYWERYLKDHVPTMTSNTAPYGEVIYTSSWNSGFEPYKAFDNNDSTNSQVATSGVSNIYLGYKYTNPTCIKKAIITIKGGGSSKLSRTFKLQGSNNNSTWTDLGSESQSIAPSNTYTITINANSNNTYYLYYRILSTDNWYQSGFRIEVHSIQFYGRSFNVSVPVMTSNTAPYGEALGDEFYDHQFEAFDGVTANSGTWTAKTASNSFVGYDFGHKVKIKKIWLKNRTHSENITAITSFKLQGSNDNSNWIDIETFSNNVTTSGGESNYDVSMPKEYRYYGIYIITHVSPTSMATIGELQFYGVDYSEREFAEGSTMKYLYDHGVELETIDITGTVTKGDDHITLSAANAQASHTLGLTPYDLLRGKVGDHMSGTTALIAGTTATANMTAANAPNNESLNVSSVNASLATGAKMTGAGVCDITELWLE